MEVCSVGPGTRTALKDETLISSPKVHNLSMEDLCQYLRRDLKKHWYTVTLGAIRKVADPRTPTMKVDIEKGKYVLRYNSEWYKHVPIDRASYILEHEMLRIHLKQIPRGIRAYQRAGSPEAKQRLLAALPLAQSCAINSMMAAHSSNNIYNDLVKPRDYNLPDLMSMEYYLFEIMKDMTVVTARTAASEYQHKVQKHVATSGATPDNYEKMESVEDDVNQDDEGSWEGLSDQELDNTNVVVSKNGSVNRDIGHIAMDFNPEDYAQDAASLDRTADMASAASDKVHHAVIKKSGPKGFGSSSGYFNEALVMVGDVNKAQWVSAVSNRIKNHFENSYQYIHNQINYDLVTLDSGVCPYGVEVSDHYYHILLGLETSMSMSEKQLGEGLKICQALVDGFDNVKVKVIEYDVGIHKRYYLEKGGHVDPKVRGRGGTGYNHFFEEAFKQQGPDGIHFPADIVLTMTDGWAPEPAPEWRFSVHQTPLLWAITADGKHPCPGYGDEIRMEE